MDKNLSDLKSFPTLFLEMSLDALPIKQFCKSNNIWYEKYIQKKGKVLSYSKNRYDIKKIEKKLNIKLSSNQNF